MMLLASAAPIEAPTPAVPLTATDTAAAMMVAWINESLFDSITTSPALTKVDPDTKALVLVKIVLLAFAPAPVTATPAAPPKPTARDAACVVASISADSSATTPTFPDVVVKAALVIDA